MFAHHHFTNPKAFDHRVSNNKVYVGHIKTVYLLGVGQSLMVKGEMVLNCYRRYRKGGMSAVVQYQKISVSKVLEDPICFIDSLIYPCLFAKACDHFFAQIGLYKEAFYLHLTDNFQIIRPCLNIEFPYTMNMQLADGQKNAVGMLS